jgi:hypothetical protein
MTDIQAGSPGTNAQNWVIRIAERQSPPAMMNSFHSCFLFLKTPFVRSTTQNYQTNACMIDTERLDKSIEEETVSEWTDDKQNWTAWQPDSGPCRALPLDYYPNEIGFRIWIWPVAICCDRLSIGTSVKCWTTEEDQDYVMTIGELWKNS